EAGNYTNPHVFDPLRHDPSRCEGNSFDIIGFGGGRHKCPGMNFAYNNMAIITTRLFQRLTLELLTPNITNIHEFGTNLPKGINIRYHSRLQ
ncbi:MAG: cytochrome P450, partial [Chloroflexales bacterium]|nr:cytochrome P450 [Chloroflexales bacterium]